METPLPRSNNPRVIRSRVMATPLTSGAKVSLTMAILNGLIMTVTVYEQKGGMETVLSHCGGGGLLGDEDPLVLFIVGDLFRAGLLRAFGAGGTEGCGSEGDGV